MWEVHMRWGKRTWVFVAGYYATLEEAERQIQGWCHAWECLGNPFKVVKSPDPDVSAPRGRTE